jgi:8-oxo-dGTP pyrophosphatase MutT (NUDIX family)
MNKLRHTARALVVRNGEVLLFERWRGQVMGPDLHYFSIPGGGIDEGESPEDAVVREMREEMTIEVRPLHLLARQKSKSRYNYYFLCEIIAGEPTFNPQSDEAKYARISRNIYEVAWQPIDQVAKQVRHREYGQLLELLPELLKSHGGKTVDIVLSDE